ncbi:MAG: methyl-accepting chemotaxis protein [Pseudomonadota bacterium]
MKLNQLKIGLRLNLAFGLVWAIMILLAGVAYFQQESIRAEQGLSEQQERRAALASEWRQLTNVNLSRSMGILLSQSNPEVSGYFAPQIKVTTEQINAIQKEMETALTSDKEKALMGEIADQRRLYISAREEAFKLTEGPAITDAVKTKLVPAAQNYTASIDELAQHQKDLVAQRAVRVLAGIERSEWLMLILVVSGIAVGAIMTRFITRSVIGPIERAVKATQTIASGDLSRKVAVEGRDELSQLQVNLGAMQESLRQLVSNIRESTDSISTASVEIATGNLDLGQRTEQTASNLQQTTASMDHLTTNVKHSADNARQANQLASNAAEVAARGGQVVSQVVSTMDEINASSKKISDIIGVIDGIAFQTNILALNAAVEAARAGEQGRGFAVVASEVRSLAGRSAEAAKEIKSLIGASVERVETGSRLVEDAGTTMQEIVTSVQRVSDIIGEISAAAAEQSDGISQVNTSVVQLDEMTQQNAALVEEGAAAAESLRDQAQRLTRVVNTFKLGAGDDTAVAQAPAAAATRALPSAPTRSLAKPAPKSHAPNAVARAKPVAAVRTAVPAPPPSTPPAPAASAVSDEWENF